MSRAGGMEGTSFCVPMPVGVKRHEAGRKLEGGREKEVENGVPVVKMERCRFTPTVANDQLERAEQADAQPRL